MSIYSALGIPKQLRDNLVWRNELQDRCDSDLDYRAAVREAVHRDLLFFFNAFLFTYDDRTKLKHLPFITYPFQDEYLLWLNDRIENEEDGLTDKSRDMGVTDMILGCFLWRWLTRYDSFLLGSITEKLVDTHGNMLTHFERLRHKLYLLPEWLLPIGFNKREHDAYMRLVNPESKNAILGAAMTPEFGRQGRYKATLLDEFAFVQFARQVWQATGDSTRCRLPVSTPGEGGMSNYFAWLRWESKMATRSLHWTLHPLKTPEWYENEKKRRRPHEIARELDISYEDAFSLKLVVQPSWVRSCRQITANLGPVVRIVVCDIARFGDDETVIYVMEGYKIIHTLILTHQDTMTSTGQIKRLFEDFGCRAVVVESVGMGAGVVDRLTEQGVAVVPINPGEQSSDPTKYFNFRAEIWWTGADLIRDTLVSLPDDDELARQLVCPVYEIKDSGGKVKIETKDGMKERLGRSPDRADALMMGLWAVRALSAVDTMNQHGIPDTITGEQAGLAQRVEVGRKL